LEVHKDKSFFCSMLKDTTCAVPEEEWGDDEEFLMDDEGGGGRGEKFADKRQKETKDKQQGFQGKRKGEGAEKRKHLLFEGAVTAGKAQRVDVGGAGGVGGALKQGRAKCPHNRLSFQCKECGAAQFCEHDRRRSRCKLCGGSQICEHNRIKTTCKLCGGSEICEHNRPKHRCKLCGGSDICEHNRIKSRCKSCGGSAFCEHNRRKDRCKKNGECFTLLQNAELEAAVTDSRGQSVEKQMKAGEGA
jgi:hypothetical protein